MWARFDDRFNHHPKILDAGPVATTLHMRAIIYCCEYRTDGFISARQVEYIVNWLVDSHYFVEVPRNSDLAKRLVEVGLWKPADKGRDGWLVHDFLEYNPSSKINNELSRKRAEAGRRGGLAKGRNSKQRAKQSLADSASKRASKRTKQKHKQDTADSEIAKDDGYVELSAVSADKSGYPTLSGVNSENTENSKQVYEANETAALEQNASKSLPRTRTRTFLTPTNDLRSFGPSSYDDSDLAISRSLPLAVVCIPVVGNGTGGEWSVTQPLVDELQSAYPGVDVVQQLHSMRQWCLANPTRRKTARGVRRFVNAWLARQQNNGGSPIAVPQRTRGGSKFQSATEAAMQWAIDGDRQDARDADTNRVHSENGQAPKLLPERG